MTIFDADRAKAHRVAKDQGGTAAARLADLAAPAIIVVTSPQTAQTVRGIVLIPNRMAVSVYSPPSDTGGNSVRGIPVMKDFARCRSLHLFATPSQP